MTFELIPDATSPREAKDSAREEAHVVSAKCLRARRYFKGVGMEVQGFQFNFRYILWLQELLFEKLTQFSLFRDHRPCVEMTRSPQ